MRRTLSLACLTAATILFGAGMLAAQGTASVELPSDDDDGCINPKKDMTVNVGDTVCLRDPGFPGPFMVPPLAGGGCPVNYSPYQITTLDEACTAAHILCPEPAGCSPECCKSITVVFHESRTLTSCKRIKERDCQKEGSDTEPGGAE